MSATERLIQELSEGRVIPFVGSGANVGGWDHQAAFCVAERGQALMAIVVLRFATNTLPTTATSICGFRVARTCDLGT